MDDKLKPFKTPQDVQAAFKLLLQHARRDYGGARRCAMFLLSLWDGTSNKADLQDLMYCDADMFAAMMRLYQYLYASNQQLYSLVAEDQIKPVIDAWGQTMTAAGADS
jgi:hypothetical protein